MKRSEFNEFMENFLLQTTEIMTTKGNDYAGDEDVLTNFKTNASRLGLDPAQVWAVYFMKHIDAILTHVRDGEVKSEPIEGRVSDAINYLILFAAMLEDDLNA